MLANSWTGVVLVSKTLTDDARKEQGMQQRHYLKPSWLVRRPLIPLPGYELSRVALSPGNLPTIGAISPVWKPSFPKFF